VEGGMTTTWDTWLPAVVSLGALAILIIVLSIASNLIQQWYADHREARNRNRSHEVPTDEQHEQSDTIAGATQAIAERFSSYNQQQHRQHKVNLTLQAITICLIFVTAGIALWQGFISRGQLSEMHDAGLDTKKLAEAADTSAQATAKLSTNNRAWVFLQYGRLEVTISDPTQKTIVPLVHFGLHNYGNSPAIIKSVEPHMLYIPLGNPNPVFPEELDPRSPSAREWRETWMPPPIEESPHPLRGMPLVTDPGAAVSHRDFVANQVIIPANGEINIQSQFWFQNVGPGPQFPQQAQAFFWPHHGQDNLEGDSWFFCDVHYTDVFGVDGETGYYARLGINGPEPPSEQNNRYNFVR
jgi:hypothetical protein